MRFTILVALTILIASSSSAFADSETQEALCVAAKTGSPADIATALKHGAKVDAICKNLAEPALDAAITVARVDNMEALIKAGAKVNRAGHPALNSVRNGASAELLLKHSARVNATSDIGNSALFDIPSNLASNFADFYQMTEQDAVDIATILVAHGAKVNFADKYGGTPLIQAAFGCLPKLTALLIEKGASVNARSSGQTALGRLENIKEMHPTECGETEQILLAHGAVK